ncbi:MAG: PaaI family thioesterase [bacterium]
MNSARDLKPEDPCFADRVRDSFHKQDALLTIGAAIQQVEPGRVEIGFEYDQRLTQQHGFIHAGILSTVLDSACGYAAYSLMPADAGVLTVEFKINLLSPAKGERFVALGEVKKPGRTITVAEGHMFAWNGEQRKLIATMTGTLMTITGRNEVSG